MKNTIKTLSYPNCSEMKRNRLVVLKASKGRCAVCGGVAAIVHHNDFAINNHAIENLTPLCIKCHKVVHANEGGYKTSKYKRRYGFSQRELAEKLGVSVGKIYELHTTNQLVQRMEERAGLKQGLSTLEGKKLL